MSTIENNQARLYLVKDNDSINMTLLQPAEVLLCLKSIEEKTGFTSRVVCFTSFQKRIDELDEKDRLSGIFPWEKQSDCANLGNPVVSEWMKVDQGKPRYTTSAFVCFAGVVTNKKGEVRIFHLLPSSSWGEASELLNPQEIDGGFFGSQCSLDEDVLQLYENRKSSDFYTQQLGLVPVRDQQGKDKSFNVLVDPVKREILCAYGDKT